MKIVERILELVGIKAKSKRDFASMIGVEQTLFNNYMIGKRSGMNFDIVDSILRTFPEISAEWLLRGNGEMIISDASSMKDIEPTYSQTSAMYESLLKDRDEQIEELKAEKNQLIGENNILREQLGIRTREKSA